jgi:hypothetical protein
VAQEQAYRAYTEARDLYNRTLAMSNETDIVELARLVSGLPEAPEPREPTVITVKKYFALSRSGETAGHNIEIKLGKDSKVVEKKCSCPGGQYRGTCWALERAAHKATRLRGEALYVYPEIKERPVVNAPGFSYGD